MLNISKFSKTFNFKVLGNYAIGAIIIVGIMLRLTVYLQCNCMYLDEANVARNIFERTYIGLVHPLNYDQFAPPVFLWLIKASTGIFGFSEYAFRLFPLICGIVSLFLLYDVLKYYAANSAIWYVMLLMALGPIYVRYAVATKQYIPDILVALVIIRIALRNRFEGELTYKLFAIWVLAGSVAIWTSMPSVFILCGAGCFYLIDIIKVGLCRRTGLLFLSIGLIWLLQFGCYYLFILKSQTSLSYLQKFHHGYFFYLPVNLNTFQQDMNLFLSLFANAGGYQLLSLVLNIGCIVIAIVFLIKTDLAKLTLVTVPVIGVIAAASIHKYSLIPRLTLFSLPLLLVLIATGFYRIIGGVKSNVMRLGIFICAAICVCNFNALNNFVKPMEEEEIKKNLDFLQQQQITGNEIYVHDLAWPAYKYYTEINPRKISRVNILGAHIFSSQMNFDSLSKTFPPKIAILYGWDKSEQHDNQKESLENNFFLTDSNQVKGSYVYIYQKNQPNNN